MRASPAFRVRIRHDGQWRGAVAALLLATAATQAAWLLGRLDESPWAVCAVLAGLDLVLLAAASTALRSVPADLRWDTQCWRLARGEETDPLPGQLTVALDLGAWMLLRFEHDSLAGRKGRIAWLPVQRRGLEAEWHALRCAVYCARPALGTDAGPNSSAGTESQE